MALNKELWIKAIEEVLWPDNAFYNYSVDHTAIGALNVKTVHIPNAGQFNGNVIVDPTVFPLTAQQRIDNDLTYDVHTFVSQPFYVNPEEQYELSYPKLQSIVYQMMKTLDDSISNVALYDWVYNLPSTSLIPTSGTTRAAGNSYQTGNRLSLDFPQVLAAHKILDQQNIPRSGRKMLVSGQLFADVLNMTKYEHAFIQMGDILETGVVGKLLGADVIMRGTYNVDYEVSANTFEIFDPNQLTGATASNPAQAADFCMIWHPDYISQCKGSMSNAGIQLFEWANSPLFLGDVVSALIRHGSSRLRYDNKGVVAIYETVA